MWLRHLLVELRVTAENILYPENIFDTFVKKNYSILIKASEDSNENISNCFAMPFWA